MFSGVLNTALRYLEPLYIGYIFIFNINLTLDKNIFN